MNPICMDQIVYRALIGYVILSGVDDKRTLNYLMECYSMVASVIRRIYEPIDFTGCATV